MVAAARKHQQRGDSQASMSGSQNKSRSKGTFDRNVSISDFEAVVRKDVFRDAFACGGSPRRALLVLQAIALCEVKLARSLGYGDPGAALRGRPRIVCQDNKRVALVGLT